MRIAYLSVPNAGTALTAGVSIEVFADATDPDETITSVALYAGNLLFSEATSAPFCSVWSGIPAGALALRAQAFDQRGGSAKSELINIMVNPTGFPPRGGIADPVANLDFAAPATLSLRANAQDSDRWDTRVEFFAGTNLLGAATSGHFGIRWANVPSGEYARGTRATDNSGLNGMSYGIALRVTDTASGPPVTFPILPSHQEPK